MGTRDDRVDAYIAKSAEFARPILTHLRDVVHAACPDVEETMKWSRPHFVYKGMLCGMSAFKEHCAFGFWKGSLIVGKEARRRQGRDGPVRPDHRGFRPALEEGADRLHQGGHEAQRRRRQVADPVEAEDAQGSDRPG